MLRLRALPDAAGLCRELPALENATVPSEIQLLPQTSGTVEGRDGRRFELRDAQAAADEQSAPIPVDIEHASELGFFGPGGQSAAAVGWIEPDAITVRENGVFARVDWNGLGRELVGDRRFRFVSPTLKLAQRFDNEGAPVGEPEVIGFSSAAITNHPNLDLKALNRAHAHADTSGNEPTEQTMKALNALLGLPESASETEACEVVAALKQAADAAPSLQDFVPRADYEAALNRADSAERAVTDHVNQARQRQVDALIEQGINDLKITPASADFYRKSAQSEDGLEALAAFLDSAPALTGSAGLPAKPAADPKTAANAYGLTERQVALCKMSGMDLKTFANRGLSEGE